MEREKGGRPTAIENGQDIRKKRRWKMLKKRKGNRGKIGNSRRRKRRDTFRELSKSKRRANRGNRMRGTRGGTKRGRKTTVLRVMRFGKRAGEMRSIKRAESRAFRRNGGTVRKRVRVGKSGGRASNRTNKTKSRTRIRRRGKRRSSALPCQPTGSLNATASGVVSYTVCMKICR